MRGEKTSPELVYKIMSSWAITGSYSETARGLKLPISTIRNIVKANKDKEEFAKLGKEKKKEFSKKANEIIFDALDRLHDNIKDREKDIPVNHLTNVIGVLYDKKALADGDATEKTIVEIKLPEGINEYAE